MSNTIGNRRPTGGPPQSWRYSSWIGVSEGPREFAGALPNSGRLGNAFFLRDSILPPGSRDSNTPISNLLAAFAHAQERTRAEAVDLSPNLPTYAESAESVRLSGLNIPGRAAEESARLPADLNNATEIASASNPGLNGPGFKVLSLVELDKVFPKIIGEHGTLINVRLPVTDRGILAQSSYYIPKHLLDDELLQALRFENGPGSVMVQLPLQLDGGKLKLDPSFDVAGLRSLLDKYRKSTMIG